MKNLHHPSAQDAEWVEKAGKLKDSVLMTLDLMPASQRTLAPTPGEWSSSAVVEHLVLVEEQLVGPWRQTLVDTPSPKLGIKSALISRMVRYVFSKTNLRVPTVPELEPTGGRGVEELKNRWDKAREQLVAALPDDAHSAWVIHPVFGPVTSEQMGRLLVAHLEHHLRHWPGPKD